MKQGQRTPRRSDELMNSDGAFVFALSDMQRVRRFLILGSEGGAYYTSQGELTARNTAALVRAIKNDGADVVKEIVEVSAAGLAPKNDPALYALALCCAEGDLAARRAAFAALPLVARTGTHLLHFAAFVNGMRGWGKSLRRAVSTWYLNLDANRSGLMDEAIDTAASRVAYQVVKYRQRDGWSHADLLRLAHPQSRNQNLGKVDDAHNDLLRYIVDGWNWIGEDPPADPALRTIWAAERVARGVDEPELIRLIGKYRLPMEVIPSERRTAAVYESVLMHGAGLTWTVRNLSNLASRGILSPGVYNEALKAVIDVLSDADRIRKARVHPLQMLVALATYRAGRGVRGHGAWQVNQDIVDALDRAFYLAFASIRPAGKRFLLALDVSGSMTCYAIAGLPGMTPNAASAALAMITKRTEPMATVMGFANTFRDLGIGTRDSLEAAMTKTRALSFGYTNCALPMEWAMQNRVEADVFVVYTDNETNTFGAEKPAAALRKYRDGMGIPARLVVVGMTATNFTIADPNDAGMMDVIGFDTTAPQLISAFAAGAL
jgi:60 kDa SS-A/Ro ribonucleoprotein